MLTGTHSILFSPDAEADRAFFRDVLELPAVDAGGGWLVFGLPPGELACHPTDGPPSHEPYLMCDDVHTTVKALSARGAQFTRPVTDEGWGLLTPSGPRAAGSSASTSRNTPPRSGRPDGRGRPARRAQSCPGRRLSWRAGWR